MLVGSELRYRLRRWKSSLVLSRGSRPANLEPATSLARCKVLSPDRLAEGRPARAVIALHLEFSKWEIIRRAGIDRDARQQHRHCVILEAGRLTQHIGSRQIIATASQHFGHQL